MTHLIGPAFFLYMLVVFVWGVLVPLIRAERISKKSQQ